jgi:hypothetical protein
VLCPFAFALVCAAGPTRRARSQGDVYREYRCAMRGNDCYVTDSDWPQRRAKDVWGGHARASDRKLWFNGGDGIPC